MSSIRLKSFAIQLTDIWSECQKEMIEMSDKIINLNNCLKTLHILNKHLTKCNETLVSIVEKCRIDDKNNNEIIVLINRIKDEEIVIEREKQNLISIESRNEFEFNYNKVHQMIKEWIQCKHLSLNTEHKSTQTLIQNDYKLETNSILTKSDQNFDLIENEININNNELIDTKVYIERQDLNQNNLNVLNENKSFESLNDNKSDYVLSDEQMSDLSDFYQSVDINDRDFELSPLSNRKRKKSTKETNKSLVLLKVDNHFVCNQMDCQFRTNYKNSYIRHLKTHETNGINGENCVKVRKGKSKTQKRIDEAVLHFKVDNQYVCNQSNCQFVSNNKETFYKHLTVQMKEHTKPKLKVMVHKSEELLKIDELISNSIVDNKYVCTETNCGFESAVKHEFRKHLRLKHNPRPFSCDWPGCESQFKKFSHLKQHKECIHLEIRKYECDWPGCTAKMLTSHHFKIHKRTHTKERPWKCDWPGCEYSGSAQWCVIAHKRRHTGEKPYECPWPDCNYRCSQPCGLTQHKRKHTGEKPYRCAVKGCGKQFAAMAGLHSHRDTHHNRDSNWKRKNAKH